jgi:hypothetical protein
LAANPVETIADFRKGFKLRQAILIGKENILAPVPARGNVVDSAG